MTNFEKECDGCGYVKSHQGDSAYCIDCSTTNNDLIPRKEVEKMIQELLEIRRTNRDNSKDHEFWNVCDSQIAALEEVLGKVSQIERVNGGIAVTELTGNIKCFFTDGNEYGVGYKFRDDYRGISFIPTHYMPCPPIINKV